MYGCLRPQVSSALPLKQYASCAQSAELYAAGGSSGLLLLLNFPGRPRQTPRVVLGSRDSMSFQAFPHKLSAKQLAVEHLICWVHYFNTACDISNETENICKLLHCKQPGQLSQVICRHRRDLILARAAVQHSQVPAGAALGYPPALLCVPGGSAPGV